ncbi:hypothetical protein [Gimesia alba]|uniref:hypothetical protein n=1 Tax=Gimesia alba TaxID=2527973 RepID=UPI0011A6B670|nr:hypothetical protein [Gimesia alba]
MSTQPPRRRRRSKRSADDEVVSPRRRKKTSDGSVRKQAVNDTIIMKSIAAVAVCFAVIYFVFIFDWRDVGVAVGMDRSVAKLRDDLKYYQQKQLNLVASLDSKEQADAAASQLDELAKSLAEISVEYDNWRHPTDEDEIRAAQNRAPEVVAAERQISEEISRLMSQHPAQLTRASSRPADARKLGAHISYLVYRAKKEADKYGKELKLEKAKEGAFKEGYSPVTADTRLAEGMHLQGIDDFCNWADCIVRTVNQDGTVRVSFHDQTTQEIFGHGSAYFDKKLERDQLRIPDGVGAIQVQQNPTPSRTGRRIEGTVKRPGVTGKRILSHPPAKTRSDRSF